LVRKAQAVRVDLAEFDHAITVAQPSIRQKVEFPT
jgi:hypothetical protein